MYFNIKNKTSFFQGIMLSWQFFLTWADEWDISLFKPTFHVSWPLFFLGYLFGSIKMQYRQEHHLVWYEYYAIVSWDCSNILVWRKFIIEYVTIFLYITIKQKFTSTLVLYKMLKWLYDKQAGSRIKKNLKFSC